MKRTLILLTCIFLPVFCFAAMARDSNIDFKHQILSVVNYVLVIVSITSISQFFWPRENNKTLFHVFNMIFTVVYYFISVTFIISHKIYYEGYEALSNLSCVRKFFFDFDVSMALQLIVIFSFFINILYIMKYGKDYYLDMV